MKKTAVRSAAAGLALLCSMTRAGMSAEAPGGNYRSEAIYLDQGWDSGTTQWWYYVSQGTVFMPYEWFVALEQASGDAPFASSDHLERLGFLPSPRSEDNPLGLPVGFARRDLDNDAWKGKWVGFACAACHTGQLNYHGQQIRIDGGPAHNDIETFGDELSAALAATATSEPRFRRFAARVIAMRPDVSPIALRAQFGAFLTGFKARSDLFKKAQSEAGILPTVSGTGRLDAVHRGGNLLLAAPLMEPRNYVPTTAPVSYPAIWDTPYMDWVLYNASIRQPLARNVVEALGVQAPADPRTYLQGTVVHGVLMDNVVQIHRALTKLESPKWPEEILGAIDRDKAEQGAAIYNANCAGCHQVVDRVAHGPPGETGQDATPGIVVRTVPLNTIGTDARHAATFASRNVTLEKIGGPASIAYLDAARIVTGRIVEQWAQQTPQNTQAEREVDAGKANEFRGLLAYRARPLNGFWATPPFLHNGSVPSLHDLLLPAAERPSLFYTGNWEFNPATVGLVSGSYFPGAFLFDTRQPGNSNAGHEYGTQLGEPDRMRLIEFLKTL